MNITLAKGGSKERTVQLSQIVIPDLWHVAQTIKNDGSFQAPQVAAGEVLECWHLAHDLLRTLRELEVPGRS